MNYRAVEIADRAAGTFESDLLTDMSLLSRRTVLGYLDPDEELQYLFVNRNRGLRASELKHPDVADDFTTNGRTQKHPKGGCAAVMAITSERVLYLIGRSNEDLRFSVALGDITAARRETNQGLVEIAVRNSELKFLFTPQPPQDADDAVAYIRGQIESSTPQTTTTTGPTYKYSVDPAGSSPGSNSDSESGSEADRNSSDSTGSGRQESDGRADTGSDGKNEQTAEDWDWVEDDDANDDTAGSDPARTRRTVQADDETVVGKTDPGGTETRPGLTAATERGEDHKTASEDAEGDTDGDEPTEMTASEPPSVVTSHVEASREAFAEISSPYEDPDAAYSAAVEAYGELCRGLHALPSDGFDEYEKRLESQLVELESLIELLDDYGPILTAARDLVGQSAGLADKAPGDGGPSRDALADELAELHSEASKLTVETEPIERLRAQLTDSEGSRGDGGEGEQPNDSDSLSDVDSDPAAPDASPDDGSDASTPDEPSEAPSDGSSLEADDDSTPAQSPGTADSTRTERVAHQLFLESGASVSEDTREVLYDLAETLDEFDVRSAKLNDARNVLSTLEGRLKAAETIAGVQMKYLDNVRHRVEKQHGTVDELLETLIETRRRVRIGAGEHTSLPQQELVELRERLSEGVELSERLNRDPTRLQMLLDEVDELLEAAESERNDSSEAQQDPTGEITAPDPNVAVDQSTDIRANEVSEWYDAVRNLAEVTAAIKDGISDVDAPMRDWCEAVGQFAANGGERHPAYGKLQMEHNWFSMSDYRAVYGNGERTTEFHFVEVEPLTRTVHTILQRVSGRSMDEVYLPVAPASKVRLPVIVETPDELQRAVGLLEEVPTQIEPATSVEDEDTDESSSGADTDGSPGTEAMTEPTDESTDDTEESDHDEGGGGTSGDGNSPLTDLGGVTPQVAEALRRAGITSREQLVSTDMDELAGIDGVGKAIAQRIKMQVG